MFKIGPPIKNILFNLTMNSDRINFAYILNHSYNKFIKAIIFIKVICKIASII